MISNSSTIPSIFPEWVEPLCERCLNLEFSGLWLIASEDVRLLKSRSEKCRLCDLIYHTYELSDMFGTNSSNIIELWRVQGGLALGREATPILSIYSIPSAHEYHGTQVQDAPKGFPKLPSVGSQTYFEGLQQWIQDCDKNHKNCDPTRPGSALFRTPTRLINVHEKGSPKIHLVETRDRSIIPDQHLKYIAVSYLWGDNTAGDFYCTTQQNINYHKSGIDISTLPQTFRDAVRVTRELGVQYVWIDSLCIIQGPGGDFDEEAKHMETVFSSAYCVIAATRASGMSSGFLHEKRPDRKIVKVKQPRKSPFYVCEFIDNFQQEVIEGRLNRRGWVLQERALARRTIYFAEKQTYWECGEGIRCETLAKMRNNQAALLGDPNFPKVATDSNKGGQIRLYELLYAQYSRLQFTHAFDRPLGIGGLEQRLIRAFETQGGYGVFSRYFGRSLLWQRDTIATPQGMQPIRFPESQYYRVPSWSWMAYEGAITFLDLPFRKIDWEWMEVSSPWDQATSPALTSSSWNTNDTGITVWHTAETHGRIDLTATARDFRDSEDAHIVYDRGERPKSRVVKCVVVGRTKVIAEISAAERVCYVLVIAKICNTATDAVEYERIGVGTLPGDAITLEGPGSPVKVF